MRRWRKAIICISLLFYSFFLFSCSNAEPKEEEDISAPVKIDITKFNDETVFDQYCNDRFGYCISYPAFFYFPLAESENGDGKIFVNRKGKEILRVYGIMKSYSGSNAYKFREQFIADLLNIRKSDAFNEVIITDTAYTKGTYVISGYTSENHFYQKVLNKPDALAYAVIHFPLENKSDFDRFTGRILSSFK